MSTTTEHHGPCICNTGPGTDGPDEFCPQHGRPYSDLMGYLDEIARERDALAARLAPVEALAEMWQQRAATGWVCDHQFEGATCLPCFRNIDHAGRLAAAALAAPSPGTEVVR